MLQLDYDDLAVTYWPIETRDQWARPITPDEIVAKLSWLVCLRLAADVLARPVEPPFRFQEK